MSDDLQMIREEVKQLCGNCERLTEDEVKENVLGIMAVGFSFGLNADRPQGKWILFPMGYLVCSVCGSHHSNSKPCNYCDNCGARMKGADDDC